jgi:hypothetical protein
MADLPFNSIAPEGRRSLPKFIRRSERASTTRLVRSARQTGSGVLIFAFTRALKYFSQHGSTAKSLIFPWKCDRSTAFCYIRNADAALQAAHKMLFRNPFGYAKVCTITGPAIAVACPTSNGARFCSIQAMARLFASSAPA